jgi:autotransporter adhesin
MNVKGRNSVVLGADSDGSQSNVVAVGSTGNERRITHVRAGTDDTDAVNKAQLDALEQQTTGNDIMLNNRINNLDQRTTGNDIMLNNRISDLDSKVNKVGAGAAALAALHPIEMDNKFGMGISYGNYRNASSMAMGLFYRPKDNLMFSIGGSMGNGENMINAGISIALDKGFTNSKAVMARTIRAQGEALEEQRKANAEQEAKIQTLEKENAAIKEQNAKLEARLAAIEAKMGK